jgi:hypothetical protein
LDRALGVDHVIKNAKGGHVGAGPSGKDGDGCNSREAQR